MREHRRSPRFLSGILFFLLALALTAGVPAVLSAGVSVKAQAKSTSDGWHGKKYYKNGKAVTGMVKIDGKYYYFGKKGNKKTQYWYTDKKGRRYYFDKKGVRVTGIKKISGNYYYFRSNGVQLTSDKTVGKYQYYVDISGYLEGYTKTLKSGKVRYYNPNGKKMSSKEKRIFQTTQYAKKVVRDVTTEDMTQAQKLEKCFRWVISKPYRLYTHHTSTWYCDYAEDHFLRGSGDCRADGSAMAFLAKALGYKNVYVCMDSSENPPETGHCWCEIDGLVYDPLFAKSKSFSKYFGTSYSTAGLWRIYAVQLS